jgi:Family of unknown function (DUF6600)
MKKMKHMLIVLILGAGMISIFPKKAAADPPYVSFQVFYNALSPYGQWVNYGSFGYAWVPNAGPGFMPYSTDGHWVYTSYGWTWVSDYSWGWAPFHYGRWLYDDYYGWIWIPGTEWGPAWVTWREDNDYYGWAPLAPGWGINVTLGAQIPIGWWIFVPARYIGSPQWHNYYIPRYRNNYIVEHTTFIDNIYMNNGRATYFRGPQIQNVERITGQPVRTFQVRGSDRAGETVVNNNEVRIFRPAINRTIDNSGAPARIYSREQVQPLNRRPNDNGQVRTFSPQNLNNRSMRVTTGSEPSRNNSQQPAPETRIQNSNNQRTNTTPQRTFSNPAVTTPPQNNNAENRNDRNVQPQNQPPQRNFTNPSNPVPERNNNEQDRNNNQQRQVQPPPRFNEAAQHPVMNNNHPQNVQPRQVPRREPQQTNSRQRPPQHENNGNNKDHRGRRR